MTAAFTTDVPFLGNWASRCSSVRINSRGTTEGEYIEKRQLARRLIVRHDSEAAHLNGRIHSQKPGVDTVSYST